MYNELETAFARSGLRLTTPRRAIFKALYQTDHPTTIKELTRLVSNVDRVSIYRTLDLFTKLGIAETVPLGWKQRYELTSPYKPHHHHLYCTSCSRLIDIQSQKLERLVAAIALEYQFTPTGHTFEISGLCASCKK